jgi:hypothetical protein
VAPHRQSDDRCLSDLGTVIASVLGVLASLALFSSPLHADERPAAARDRELAYQQKVLENKLALIARMLDGESAQRVLDADNSNATEKFSAAKAAYADALSAIERQQLAKASHHADEALRLGGQAIREAATRKPDTSLWTKRYQDLHERVSSYSLAYASVLSDDSRTLGAAIPQEELDQLMLQAEKLARSGQYEDAVNELSALAVKLESELVRLRHQQTLVHELKFETPEDEYKYELERNRSYAMLLQMAVTQEGVHPTAASQSPQILQANETERERAQSAAAVGDAAQALKIIEAATDKLAQALRKTGMYLP